MSDQAPPAVNRSASTAALSIKSRVGVVVIGRNEGKRLIKCLESLAPLGLEIVYVDSASTDGSPAAARTLGGHVLDLDLTKPFTAARARNEGFEELRSIAPDIDYVQFVDGDCEMEAGWIERAAAFLDERPDVAVVCGRRRERYPNASFYNSICDREWDTPIGECDACGGDALMQVSSFVQVDGFNSALIAHEEPELCSRIRASGQRIWRIDEAMTIHDAAIFTFSQWWKRNKRAGFGYSQALWFNRHFNDKTGSKLIARAVFWAGLLPLIFIAAAPIFPAIIFGLPLVYLIQIFRLSIKSDDGFSIAWKHSALTVISKFPELQGALDFVFKLLFRRKMSAILYK